MNVINNILCILLLVTVGGCTAEERIDEVAKQPPERSPDSTLVVAEQIGNNKDSSLIWVLYDTIPNRHWAYGGNVRVMLEGGTWQRDRGSRLIVEGGRDYNSIEIFLSDTSVFQQNEDLIPSHNGIILPRASVDLTDKYGHHQITTMIDGTWRKFTWDNELYKFVRVIVHDSMFTVIYTNQYPRYR